MCLALPAAAQDTRGFTDDQGREVQIPAAPQRIASICAEQFTTALYELGAPVVASSGRTADGVNGGAPYIRGALTVFDLSFENSDIAYVGDWKEPDLEAIAAASPDLIVISENTAAVLDQLTAIAPTVVLDYRDTPWLDRYRRLADAAGRLPKFERRLASYNRRLEAGRIVVADALGDPSQVSVAIAEVFGERFLVYREYSALTEVIRDLGFSMPPMIAATEAGFTEISLERLPEVDADFLIGTYNVFFDQTPSSQRAAFEALLPMWDEVLHAPRHGQHIYVDRNMVRPLSFEMLQTTLALLVTNIAGRDFVPLPE